MKGFAEMTDILQTGNLILRPADVSFAETLLNYYIRNKDFLERFEPKRDEVFYTCEGQSTQLQSEMAETQNKQSYHFYISEKNSSEIIGSVGLNSVVWGCFLSCFIGYKLDGQLINKGYMTQAVRAVADFTFQNLHLHRIEGNVMPRNMASRRVLEKCGFAEEGLAKQYLKINGIWEDHIHMVLLNQNM